MPDGPAAPAPQPLTSETAGIDAGMARKNRKAVTRKNRRILCFVDESGTAGAKNDQFSLGCVVVFASEAGRADKTFSDLLHKNVNEVHAAEWQPNTLKGLINRFANASTPESLLMVNRLCNGAEGKPAELYAMFLVETVKMVLKMFGKRQGMEKIGNVHVIVDENQHSTDRSFREVIDRAMGADGYFRAVEHVVVIDSKASRLLQLADVVAYARALVGRNVVSAAQLEEFGIHLT